jgi:D-beta-D-heptose 7-phosphate kinase/D-beta-D-heptose 1-phosphate adenosyltransferase
MKIWTNGCFDIIHRGHIELFRFCKILAGAEGEVIVGIDSDKKVREDKGKTRPINSLEDRMAVLYSSIFIDKVIPFDSSRELERTIKWIQPHAMVIGSDWKDKEVIGSAFAQKLIFFDRVGDYSTTKILESK